MADSKITFVPFPAPSQKPKTQPQSEAKEIAKEVLAVVRDCAKALHTYHTETEIALGELCGLLDGLELMAVRVLALHHLEQHKRKTQDPGGTR